MSKEIHLDSSGNISKYRALVDTSSVVAHDLCAQLHVLQFCLEELGEHVSDSGQEYLNRMGVSTSYIANLVDSFRKQLKISLSDDEPENLDKIVSSALELVKNHFFIVIEKLELSFEGDFTKFMIKHSGRKSMLMIFALYATFIEDFKEKSLDEHQKMSMILSAQAENSRFVKLSLEINQTDINEDKFENILSQSAPEKGKIRKFVGLNLIEEYRKENADWFHLSHLPKGAVVELTIPLHL
tara:strand:- start:1861 stop:2583 length:723 start_codon:yes stop_codon:yes gene_type:complete